MTRKPFVYPGKTDSVAEKFSHDPKAHEKHLAEPPLGGWDANYVPGYSDHRHLNELRVRRGEKPIPLPAKLHWIRATGERVGYRDLMEWTRKGYKVIDDAEERDGKPFSETLAQHGWGWPPVGTIQNGMIRKGNEDLILAYVDGDRARQNEREDAEYRAMMEGASGEAHIESETETRETVQLSDADVKFD
jgi:hypothetical protein